MCTEWKTCPCFFSYWKYNLKHPFFLPAKKNKDEPVHVSFGFMRVGIRGWLCGSCRTFYWDLRTTVLIQKITISTEILTIGGDTIGTIDALGILSIAGEEKEEVVKRRGLTAYLRM